MLVFFAQVSSINRVLRNLATENQKQQFVQQNTMYDKFGLLNGQGWSRPSHPWYAHNPVGLPGGNMYPQPAVAHAVPPPDNKSKRKQQPVQTFASRLSCLANSLFSGQIILHFNSYFYTLVEESKKS